MRYILGSLAAIAAIAALQGGSANAQYGYPAGYGAYGWGGWGGGGQTVQGSIASGMGAFAAGAGQYNVQTAQARSINANTVMNWNNYCYLSQQEANRKYQTRMAQKRYGDEQARSKIASRLRDNPEPRDIYSGDALNVAYDEVSNPSIYIKTLSAANVKIGGEAVRNIPFQYAAAAITTSFHDVANKAKVPAVLKTPAFDVERNGLKAIAPTLRSQVEEGGTPDAALLDKALKLVEAAEAKVESTLERNSRDRVDAEKYLKSLHGLLKMLQTPAIDVLLAGVEKRPDTTLAELLNFMRAFSLRFGPANTPQQRAIYDRLYPQLVSLRDTVAPALASAAPPEGGHADAGEFFSGMDTRDLRKKVTPPPVPQP
jgi:hypothetical protein